MDKLTDSLLLETYEKAKELNLHADFILMIENELNHRGLC